MILQKKDFVEIEFVGKTNDGKVFDSNIQEEVKKENLPIKNPKPFVLVLGEGMFLKGVEEFLEGKPILKGKTEEYEINLEPEKAFGKRDSKLVQLMPRKVFDQQKINPVSGAVLNFDGRLGKILSASGGRVIVDFNNPMAGKEVSYKIFVKRKLTDAKEKAEAIVEFFARKHLKCEIKEKKLVVEADNQTLPFVMVFKEKIKELLELEDVEARNLDEKKD